MTSTGPGSGAGGDEVLKDESRPMHEWRPLERFASRAADYAKFRPGYPAEALGAVLEGLGDPSGLVAADVGAGTGISSRWLAHAGLLVYAVEPNGAMRAAGSSMGHERIEWVNGTGEATGLREGSVDLVVCAQAFHWFKPDRALVEFVRILRPWGRVALVWNDRVDRDETTREYNAILTGFGADARYEESKTAAEELRGSSLFADYRERVAPNHQDMDLETAIGRTRSISTCPSQGPVWEAIRERLEAWFARRQREGKVRLVYDCRVYTARVRA